MIDGTWNIGGAEYDETVNAVRYYRVLSKVSMETARAYFYSHQNDPISVWPTGGVELDHWPLLHADTPAYQQQITLVKD